MKVTLDIDDRYAGVLTLTAIGVTAAETAVTACVYDLKKGTHINVDGNGKTTQEEEGAE